MTSPIRIRVLPREFAQNADGLGVHKFKCVDWSGNVRLYERQDVKATFFGYEVFVVQINGPDAYGPLRESYPGSRSFGKTAWFCTSMESAAKRFQALVKAAVIPRNDGV